MLAPSFPWQLLAEPEAKGGGGGGGRGEGGRGVGRGEKNIFYFLLGNKKRSDEIICVSLSNMYSNG